MVRSLNGGGSRAGDDFCTSTSKLPRLHWRASTPPKDKGSCPFLGFHVLQGDFHDHCPLGLQILLALLFGFSGGAKAFWPETALRQVHLPPTRGRVLGILEVLGAMVLILTGLPDTPTVLTLVAAICFAVVWIGAILFHHKDPIPSRQRHAMSRTTSCLALTTLRVSPYPLG